VPHPTSEAGRKQLEWYDQYPEEWEGKPESNGRGAEELENAEAEGEALGEPSRLIRLLNEVPEAARIVKARRAAFAEMVVDFYLASLEKEAGSSERRNELRRSDEDLS
jgi:hypothetical protein